jgi:hypothetical protein
MLDSRIRKYAKERTKQTNDNTTQIFDDSEVSTLSYTSYSQRATSKQLEQLFISAQETLFIDNTSDIINEIKLLKKIEHYAKNDTDISPNEYRDLLERIKDKKQELNEKRREKRGWMEQFYILKPGKLSSLVQANRLLKRPPEVYTLSADRCLRCQIPFKFDPGMCRFICRRCYVLVKTLFSQEDTSGDSLILKSKTSGIEPVIPKLTPAMRFKLEQTQQILDQQREKKIIDSINNYKEFLAQFKDDLPPITNEIHRFLFWSLFPVHVVGKSKCKLPSIRKILRDSKDFQHLEIQAERIRRDFVREQIPKLSQDSIYRLVERYSVLLNLGTPFKKLEDMTPKEIEQIKQEPKDLEPDQEKLEESDKDARDEDENDESKPKKRKVSKNTDVEVICTPLQMMKKKEDVKRKLFNFEVISMMLLLIDGNREEACKFFLHKTRSVLTECNIAYLELVAQAREKNQELWPMNDANLL